MNMSERSKFVVIIPMLVALYFSWLNRYFYFDDALIYARYIENLMNGYGLVYNKGEYFNGLTSQLFTYLSIGTSLLFGNVLFAINFLSALFLILSVWIYQYIFSSVANPIFVSLGSLFLVTSPFTYGVFGMETFLFIFLIGLCIHLFLIEKYKFLLIAMALLILTRNEGVFLILPLVFEHFRLKRKFPKIKYFLIPIVLVSVHFIFNYTYYGAFLPATGPAKIWQGMSGLWGESNIIFIKGAMHILLWTFGNKFSLIGFFILSGVGVFHIGKSSLTFIVLLFLTFLLSFYTILNIPNYYWYDAPFIVFLFYSAAIGLEVVYSFLINYFKLNKIIILILIFSSASYFTYKQISHIKFGKSSHPYLIKSHPYEEMGIWLKNNTPIDASVAMVEIGIVGYFSDRYIIDILGLVNPFNAKYIGERKFDKWLTKYHPDYILVHDPLWGHEQSVKKIVMDGEYLEYLKFNIAGYKLFASKHLQLPDNLLSNPYILKRIDLRVHSESENDDN